MWPFKRDGAASYHSQLNDLETRVERLETRDAEERIRVLTLMEKVLHRLNARVSKREREEAAQDAPGPTIDGGDVSRHPSIAAHRRALRGF